jgi:hypothetical protein
MLGDDRGEMFCGPRLLPAGIEGRIVWNGSELYAFVFPDDGQLWAWANEKRKELEARGWTQLD